MPEIITTILIWMGTTLAYAVLRRPTGERGGAWTVAAAASVVCVVAGVLGVTAQSSTVIAGLAEATAHALTAGSLLAVFVPLAVSRKMPRRRVRVTPGAGVVSKRTARYGLSRLVGAVVVAPVAATVAVVALPKLLPGAPEFGYLATIVLIVPAMAVAPFLVLTSPSIKGAWIGSAAATVVSLVVIVTSIF